MHATSLTCHQRQRLPAQRLPACAYRRPRGNEQERAHSSRDHLQGCSHSLSL